MSPLPWSRSQRLQQWFGWVSRKKHLYFLLSVIFLHESGANLSFKSLQHPQQKPAVGRNEASIWTACFQI